MIRVTFDLSEADRVELEEFFSIPTMASTIDILAALQKKKSNSVSLQVKQSPDEIEDPHYTTYSVG